MTGTSIGPLALEEYQDIVRAALAEDIGEGDITTAATIDPAQRARAVLVAKARCVVAGLDVAAEAFRQRDTDVSIVRHRTDGDWCDSGSVVAEVRGRATALLTAERVALNFLQRMSGTATLARKFTDAADGRIAVLDTRKTTPLLRNLEKYAVRVGGAANHRFRLDDGVLIKDNHVRLAGGVEEAVRRARAAVTGLAIEVEAQSLAEVDAALRAGADIVLLDNLSVDEIRGAVERCKGRAKTEISGGVTLDRLPALATTGATFVSVGALTHSAPAADLSFEIDLA